MINTGPDSSIIFCVDPKRGESIGEIAPLGALSKLRAMSIDYRHACASEVFRALAPEHAVPQRLLDSCAAHPVESRSRAVTSEIAPPEETTFTSSYCGSAGAANFQAEQCSQTSCLQGTLCSRFCITDLWGWHDRALTWQLGGEEGNWGEDHVASCNGNTRFRAFWRDDVGDAWVNSVDLTIGSGQLVYWYIHYYATFADGDIRFRADSNPGAGHRHTGVFMDW